MLTAYQFTFLPSWRQKAETLMHWGALAAQAQAARSGTEPGVGQGLGQR